MSKVVIVSKTKMAKGNVCIGGIDIDNHCSVRLMDKDGVHESLSDCPYNIFEIWDVEYIKTSTRALPHSAEDVRVIRRVKLGELEEVVNHIDLFERNGINIYEGNICNVFDGCLNATDSGALYITKSNVPNHSTCFWIADQDLTRNDFQGKVKYNYNDGIRRWGCNIPYVGLEDNPANIIPKGSLIRLSLAHWWKQAEEVEEKCFLQLSGFFIGDYSKK